MRPSGQRRSVALHFSYVVLMLKHAVNLWHSEKTKNAKGSNAHTIHENRPISRRTVVMLLLLASLGVDAKGRHLPNADCRAASNQPWIYRNPLKSPIHY
jgi:hypothetical protein